MACRKKYQNLDALLAADKKAKALFDQIPQYAKDQIMARGESVNSVESLSDYIENVLRGDD